MAALNNRKCSQTEQLLNHNGRLSQSHNDPMKSSSMYTSASVALSDTPLCCTGQLVLGHDSNAVKRYTTRYRINRHVTRTGPCTSALHKTLSPCCSRDNRASCVDFITAFLKSELFLLAIHLAALGAAVTKEGLGFRFTNDKLHFVLTVFEKVLCIAGILLRVFAVYNEYKDVNESLVRLEASENDKSVYSKTVQLWSVVFTLVASLTIFLVVAAFILLHLYAHLGWTILTTAVSLLLIHTFHNVLKTRNDLLLYRVTLDHHKVVLDESMMFLKEGLCFKGWVSQDFILRCRDYVLAYDVTREFRRPEYIDVCEADQLTVMLNVSTV